jgi:superfamily II DNA or RNA helicase
MPEADDKAAHSRITVRELRSLLAVQPPATAIAPIEVRPGDLVTVNGVAGFRFLSGKHGSLLSRPDLSADPRKPMPIKVDQVVAIHHRTAEGDFVIIDGVSTPRLGRVENIRSSRLDFLGEPVYLVRSLMGGQRWGLHSSAMHAGDFWPVPAEAATALLAKLYLPAPPAIPADAPPSSSPPQAARGLASLPGLPAQPAPAPAAVPAGPPMPPGELAGVFAQVAFPGLLRRYQSMALDAFDQARESGRRRAYLVLPPGAGKTLVGLEIARRLGNRCLVLGPNTAIQEQWVKQWRAYQPDLVEAGDNSDLTASITALTYQAICDLDSHNPVLEQQVAEWQAAVEGEHPAAADANPHHRAEAARLRGHARMLIASSGDHEKLLSILHPNGQRLIERIKAAGQFTIILDECHHLLEMWGYLLQALAHELGDNVFLVGLTATPPSEMDAREAVLYQELFGRADFEVPTPAVVKEGNLAPYQELAYITSPLEHELAYIAEEKTRFEELLADMMRPDLGSVSFVDWMRSRIFERKTKDGVEVSWQRFESDHPDLALAGLRYCYANQIELPDGARLGEAQRRAPDANDWVALIGDYCVGHLRESADPKDVDAWELIRKSLPSLGYVLSLQGIRSYVSPVDRVLLLSASKGVAAIGILAAESNALGSSLRALMLCDYEVAGSEVVGKLRGVLDAQAGSAALLLRTLLSDRATAALEPILVTGQTVACSRATAAALVPWLASQSPELKDRLDAVSLFSSAGGADGWESVMQIKPSTGSWSPSLYLPLITRYFEQGTSRCLLGTRGLLGEGWDAKSINVLIDLTGVTTTTSVHQMRGRSLRLDPNDAHKVANNWDVICVARDHPKGAADYERMVRKHRNYFAITGAGEIESGVGHVDQRLSPFGPPPDEVVTCVNREVIERSADREHIYALWRIGEPYLNLPIQTVRIRAQHALGVSASRLDGSAPGAQSPRFIKTRAVAGTGLGLGAALVSAAAGQELLAIGLGGLMIAGGVGWAAHSMRTYADRLGPSSSLDDLAAAIAETLIATGLVDNRLTVAAVRVAIQPDGYYRCYLEGANLPDSSVFAACLDELLAPIESPRWIISRYVSAPPRNLLGGLRLLAGRLARDRVGAAVVYHAVPSLLGANKTRVQAFQAAWNRYVSAGHALFQDDPRAQAIIQLQRGEDPFAVTTQMRTLWE